MLRHAQSDTAELCNLRVVEPYRRQHLGSALVRKAMESTHSSGARSLILGVRPGDSSISAYTLLSMYQKLGFRASGLSAAGNTVMQRAVLSLLDTSPLRRNADRVVQRMEVGTGKDRSKRIKELLNDQVDEVTISRDVRSVFRKVKNWQYKKTIM